MYDDKWLITNKLIIYKIDKKYILYNKEFNRITKLYDNIEHISYKFFICYDIGDEQKKVIVYNLNLEIVYTGSKYLIDNKAIWDTIKIYKGDYLKNKKPRRGNLIPSSLIEVRAYTNKNDNNGVLVTLFGLEELWGKSIVGTNTISSNYYSYTEDKWLLDSIDCMKLLGSVGNYSIVYCAYSKDKRVFVIRDGHIIHTTTFVDKVINITECNTDNIIMSTYKDTLRISLIRNHNESIIKRIHIKNINKLKILDVGVDLIILGGIYEYRLNKETYLLDVIK